MEIADVEMVGTEKPNESNENETTPAANEDGVNLRAVAPEEFGEGLPYAPINWPNLGDNWGWRVGRRVTTHGHYLDRYLYPPNRLRSLTTGLCLRKKGFASKLSVERFIQDAFPGVDVSSFFAAFTWKIPAKKHSSPNGNTEGSSDLPSEEISKDLGPDSMSYGVSCKAGNKMCRSLVTQAEGESHNLNTMPCEVCCSEPCFCRYCCCILCSNTISTDYGDCSYIKCEAKVEGDNICGHVSHLNCALQSYLAGTVGGSIGLDAEYYCRRCDARKDLISHVMRLLQICESIDSREDIEKILNVGACILRGSKKTSAKRLLNRVDWSIIKLKSGTSLDDLWNVEDDDIAKFMEVAGNTNEAVESTNGQDPPDGKSILLPNLTETSDYRNEYKKIDDEVDQALRRLRKSQEAEYKVAQDKLNSHLRYLGNLLNQLEKENTELAQRLPNTNSNTLLNTVLDRVKQVKRQILRLREMEKIANGFGKTSTDILKQHFGMSIDD